MTLHERLLEVQANLPHVGKTAEADVGKYSYRYATLADIHAALLPLLNKQGLTWTCGPETVDGGGFALRGVIWDGTDSVDGWWPLPATDDPQRLGSAVTYGRRYLLCALVGLVPDDDDDGRQAATPDVRAALRQATVAAGLEERMVAVLADEFEANRLDELDDGQVAALAARVAGGTL